MNPNSNSTALDLKIVAVVNTKIFATRKMTAGSRDRALSLIVSILVRINQHAELNTPR